MSARAMYVHVPFCQSICAYCDFTRVGAHPLLIEKWLDTLEAELKEKHPQKDLTTLYIGGGTPTALNEEQLKRLLELLSPFTAQLAEYTIEINPETMSLEKIALFKRYGINRISIGLQSTKDHLLKLMRRKHSWKEVQDLIGQLRRAGLDNLSLDVMYSLPQQTMTDLTETIDALIKLEIPHLSLYSLTIEKNSLFGREGISVLDEETEAEMYFTAVRFLEKAGYEHYEISNFARPGYRSKHNQVYWHYEDFYGIGLGASGKENHQRYDNTVNFEEYFAHRWVKEKIPLSKKEEEFEMLMMNLRLKEGMELERFNAYFKEDFVSVFDQPLKMGVQRGWLILEEDRVKCSESGFPILNTVLELFLD